MGALHEGHAALIHRARQLAGRKGSVFVSIFVNPKQFGPREDFSRYPRPFAKDRKVCLASGADAIFHPSAGDLYPADFSTWVTEEKVSLPLCGAVRPGHFRGVCTVVLKLFNVVQPDLAVFGQKDFQQCAVLKRMARDLDLPVRLVIAPTVREPDGLALSSRNAYLSSEERAQAPILHHALVAARQLFLKGERRVPTLVRRAAREIASTRLARLDYLEVVEAQTLLRPRLATQDSFLVVSAFFGKTRLIDNLALGEN